MSVLFEFGDLTALARSFEATPARLVAKGQVAMAEAGVLLRETWKANATITAGRHGKWYPSSIYSRPAGVLAVDVGPKPGMKQAGMSFEFGSARQPPHLDGQRALEQSAPLLIRRIEILASGVFE